MNTPRMAPNWRIVAAIFLNGAKSAPGMDLTKPSIPLKLLVTAWRNTDSRDIRPEKFKLCLKELNPALRTALAGAKLRIMVIICPVAAPNALNGAARTEPMLRNGASI